MKLSPDCKSVFFGEAVSRAASLVCFVLLYALRIVNRLGRKFVLVGPF